MGKNADTVHRLHDSFNRRDWDALVADIADECVFIDGRGEVLHGKDGVRGYGQGWAAAFSDGKITDERLYDAQDTVVTEFVGRGTNDGPLGEMPATGRPVTLPYVEIYHFDADGMVSSGRAFYDTMGLLVQLGLAPGAAAVTEMPAQKIKGKTAPTG